jgi:hypothetical protein
VVLDLDGVDGIADRAGWRRVNRRAGAPGSTSSALALDGAMRYSHRRLLDAIPASCEAFRLQGLTGLRGRCVTCIHRAETVGQRSDALKWQPTLRPVCLFKWQSTLRLPA